MRFSEAFTEFCYAKDHTPASRRWYRSRLTAFIVYAESHHVAEIEQVSAPLVRRYLEYRRATPTAQGKPLSSHTLNGHARAIKAWLNWAVNEDALDEKVVRRIALPKKEQRVLPILATAHFTRLMAACDQSEIPEYQARDRAILAVLLDTGIRANELCDLTPDRASFTLDDAYLLVNGKGRKQREVPLGKQARRLLLAYLRRRPQAPTVFVGKGGKPLTPSGLDQILYRLRDRAGLRDVRVGAHTFRHTYAVNFLANGGNLYVLSRLMGHSSVSITEGYLKAFNARQARQQAISVLDTL